MTIKFNIKGIIKKRLKRIVGGVGRGKQLWGSLNIVEIKY